MDSVIRVTKGIPRFLEDRRSLTFSLFTLVYLLGAFGDAFGRPFWFDELCSWHTARLPGFLAIVRAVNEGIEPNPPLSYALIRLSHLLLGQGEWATRLPFVLSFWLALLFLFLAVGKRCGVLLGFVSVFFICLTKPFAFAAEARPYALVLACAAASFFFWQAAADGRPRRPALTGLFVSLVFALSSHLYSVLLFAPLAVGELYRSFRSARIDWPVWAAIVLPAFAILPSVPMIRSFSAYSTSFWSQPTATNLLAATEVFYGNPLTVALLAAGCLAAPVKRRRPVPSLPDHEVAAVVTLLLLPLIGFLMAKVVTNAFYFRYFLPTSLGMAMALAFLYRRLLYGRVTAMTLLFVALAGLFFVTQAWRGSRLLDLPPARSEAVRIAKKLAVEGAAPVVVNHRHAFLEYLYYAPPETGKRLHYLVDLSAASRFGGEDTSDRALGGLRKITAVPVEDYGTFIGSHHHFWVYGSDGWLLRQLRQDGARLTFDNRGEALLVEVTIPTTGDQ